MPSYGKPYTRVIRFSAIELGLNGVTMDAARTSNSFGINGMNQLVATFTRVSGAAGATTFYFEVSHDDGTTWRRLTTSSISSGTETLSEHLVSAAATIDEGHYLLNVLGGSKDVMRVVIPSNADATATITMEITLGVSG